MNTIRNTDIKRIVIKVGTSSITHEDGHIYIQKLDKLARQIADMVHLGKEVVLVSSGAVAAGMAPLGLKKKPSLLQDKQAAAAVGQGRLIHMYDKIFREYGISAGQVLLTKGDYLHPRRYLHARNTLLRLLSFGVVPVVNENDTVSVDELKIGDNDTLSAMVGSIIDADWLIILSDVDGLYTANPATDINAEKISLVEKLTPEIFSSAQGAGTARGTGGMYTKLLAADICMNSGVNVIIASAQEPDVLLRLIEGENLGTYFRAYDVHPQMRKRRLLFGATMKGKIFVDEGCKNAIIEHGSSLLPVGIISTEGRFDEGDGVSIMYEEKEIARGMVNFDVDELKLLIGKKMQDVPTVLGYETNHTAAIHRDNLVLKQ